MISIINKMHHGYWQYCSGGKCEVCNTPWPAKDQYTPIELHLRKTDYYNRYNGNGFPVGMSGVELLQLRKDLNNEYLAYEGRNGTLEVKKRGVD